VHGYLTIEVCRALSLKRKSIHSSQACQEIVRSAVTSTESSDERTIHFGVLQEKLLVSDRTIAQTSPYATGSRFDIGVGQAMLSLRPGASVIVHSY
jgi:hypothetical protein